jgi:hypothetical protein
VRQEGVQQGLDTRVRRSRVQQVDALEIDHVLVAERVETTQAAQLVQPHRGQALRLDIAHVPAAALHTEHLDVLAEPIFRRGLHRGVAAAVKHQLRIGTKQPRRIGAQSEVFAHAQRRIARDEFLCLGVGPAGFHHFPSFVSGISIFIVSTFLELGYRNYAAVFPLLQDVLDFHRTTDHVQIIRPIPSPLCLHAISINLDLGPVVHASHVDT